MSGLQLAQFRQNDRVLEIEGLLRRKIGRPRLDDSQRIAALSTKLRSRLHRMSAMEQYVRFQPSLNELDNLVELMADLANTEYLFDDKVLKDEVGCSENRLRRTRAGNRLKYLIKEAMQRKHQFRQISLGAQEVQAEMARYLPKLPNNWKLTATNFVKAKLINEKILESQLDGHLINFDAKYSRLDRYFWNKYQMCSSFVGEELKEREDRRRTLIAENLQLQHIKELYEIAMANVIPKKETRNDEERRKLADITKEMDRIIKRNLRFADKLIAKAQGQDAHDLNNISSDDSDTENLPSYQAKVPETLPPSLVVRRPHAITTCREAKLTELPIAKPGRQRLPYRKRGSCNILTHDKVLLHTAKEVRLSHAKVSESILKHQLSDQEVVKTNSSEPMHSNFKEIQEVIEGIMIGQSADNNHIKQSIRKILLSSIELKLAQAKYLPQELKPAVQEVNSLWEAVQKTSTHQSILSRVNGSHFSV